MYKKSTTANEWIIDTESIGKGYSTTSTTTGPFPTGMTSGITSDTITITYPQTSGTTIAGGNINNPYYGTGDDSTLEKYFQRMQYYDPAIKERIIRLRVFFQSLKKKYFNPGGITEHMFSDNIKKRDAAKELMEEMNFAVK